MMISSKRSFPLLSSLDEQLREARRSSLESIVVEAGFRFCLHPQRQHALAGEIAEKVNGIYKNMGEHLQVNEEKAGHALKRLGLFTRRLGNNLGRLMTTFAVELRPVYDANSRCLLTVR